jgi:REP-associated tyrosine transposase
VTPIIATKLGFCEDSCQGPPSGAPQRSRPALAAVTTLSRHASPERAAAGARSFFVGSSTAEKRNLLQSDRSARLFIHVLYDYRAQGKFLLHEFVVMPNHFHLLLTVDSGMTLERAVQFIKGGFAFQAARAFGLKAPVWQKGFSDHRVLNGDAFHGMRKYIHNNPVKSGLVAEPADFPYSSAHPGFELDPPPPRLSRIAA